MKYKTMLLTLSMFGVMGCSETKYYDMSKKEVTPSVKIDTVLVLGKRNECYMYTNTIKYLLVNKNGMLIKHAITNTDNSIYEFSNVGDTVIIQSDKNNDINLIKNLTMENKIKAFTKQR